MRPRRRTLVVLACAVAVAAFASVAHASFFLQQETLLDRGCRAALPRIEKMLNEAATGRIVTVRTQVRLLRPGKLAGDIAFNPSGTTLAVAGDPPGAPAGDPATGVVQDFGCGHVSAGGPHGSTSGSASEGIGIPKKHVVAVVRETITRPGRYTLTFTLDQQGRQILARLGARERAYRKHHPQGKRPPTITWGIGLHFLANG